MLERRSFRLAVRVLRKFELEIEESDVSGLGNLPIRCQHPIPVVFLVVSEHSAALSFGSEASTLSSRLGDGQIADAAEGMKMLETWFLVKKKFVWSLVDVRCVDDAVPDPDCVSKCPMPNVLRHLGLFDDGLDRIVEPLNVAFGKSVCLGSVRRAVMGFDSMSVIPISNPLVHELTSAV